jgi:hypothetical protein
MPSDVSDRDSAFRNLIKAAWRFLDHTKDQRELQDMEEYRDLGRAMNEAAEANANKVRVRISAPPLGIEKEFTVGGDPC